MGTGQNGLLGRALLSARRDCMPDRSVRPTRQCLECPAHRTVFGVSGPPDSVWSVRPTGQCLECPAHRTVFGVSGPPDSVWSVRPTGQCLNQTMSAPPEYNVTGIDYAQR